MRGPVDFIRTNLKGLNQILRPGARQQRPPPVIDKKQRAEVKIEKTFVPESNSDIKRLFGSQIEGLKQMLKKEKEEEKKKKAAIAEGKISREGEDLEKPKQPEVKPVQEKVVVDESGQIRDEQGNIILVKQRKNDLLFNKKKEQDLQIKEMAKRQRIKQTQRLSRSFMDRNLLLTTNKKRNRRSILGLQFLEKGSYQVGSSREVREQVQNLSDVLKQQEAEVRIVKKRNRVSLQFNRETPSVQWWDVPLLGGKTYQQVLNLPEGTELEGQLSQIDALQMESLIDWAQIKDEALFQKVGSVEDDEKVVVPTYLTKDEKKKLKRKRKMQKLQEKNDQIRLGLIKPDRPKLRVGNMAIVLKDEFIMDPSRVEAEAKQQTQERIDKHNQTNSQRKLTKTQKKDKVIRKLKRDSAKECRRAVFRVDRLTEPTHLFKVNMNAKQLALNGLVIKPNNEQIHFPAMVLVEGGLRAVKFYKNLMLRRIRWNEDGHVNDCKLVWEGQVEDSTAGKWRMHQMGDQVEAIRLLTEKKMEHFWEYMSM